MNNNFKSYTEAAEMLKALAHPVRLCIVKGLLEKKECNVTYMQECLNLPQSTVSQHLQKLRSLGIVDTRRNGLEVNYTVADERVKELVRILLREEEL